MTDSVDEWAGIEADAARAAEAWGNPHAPVCQACLAKQRYVPATEVDHILAKAKGGTDAPDNLRALCAPCHRDKTIRDAGGKPKQAFGVDGWPIE